MRRVSMLGSVKSCAEPMAEEIHYARYELANTPGVPVELKLKS